MNKYYITFGKFRLTIGAIDKEDACIKTLVRYMNWDKYNNRLPKLFQVSESGFEQKGDELIFTTEDIVKTMIKNNDNE